MTRIFDSIRIVNYRVFENLAIDGVPQITILGGINGSGKTTFLEAVFQLLDRRHPLSFLKPYGWRGVPTGPGVADDLLTLSFHKNNVSSPISITTTKGNQTTNFSLSYGPEKIPESQTISNTQTTERGRGPALGTESSYGTKARAGLTATTTIDGKITEKYHAVWTAAGQSVNFDTQSPELEVPSATILSAKTRDNLEDIADRFTEIKKRGEYETLISYMNLINPKIKSLELLQNLDKTILYADVGLGKLIPCTMLGEGQNTLLSIALAIMNSDVVLLDEFDTAIHYTALPDLWRMIHTLAKQEDCQIFVSKHSRECVQAATDALDSSAIKEDLCYIRLDKPKGKVKATKYEGAGLISAINEEWEIR